MASLCPTPQPATWPPPKPAAARPPTPATPGPAARAAPAGAGRRSCGRRATASRPAGRRRGWGRSARRLPGRAGAGLGRSVRPLSTDGMGVLASGQGGPRSLPTPPSPLGVVSGNLPAHLSLLLGSRAHPIPLSFLSPTVPRSRVHAHAHLLTIVSLFCSHPRTRSLARSLARYHLRVVSVPSRRVPPGGATWIVVSA
jgi:hypothetical protein